MGVVGRSVGEAAVALAGSGRRPCPAKSASQPQLARLIEAHQLRRSGRRRRRPATFTVAICSSFLLATRIVSARIRLAMIAAAAGCAAVTAVVIFGNWSAAARVFARGGHRGLSFGTTPNPGNRGARIESHTAYARTDFAFRAPRSIGGTGMPVPPTPRCHVRSVAHLVCSTSYAVGVAACSTGTNSMTIELISSVPSLPAPSGMFAGMYCVEPAGVYCTPAVVDSSTIVPSGA